MNVQVNNQIAQDNDMIEEIIRNEILKIHSMVDASNEYDQIMNELKQVLKKGLHDEALKLEEEILLIRDRNYEINALNING